MLGSALGRLVFFGRLERLTGGPTVPQKTWMDLSNNTSQSSVNQSAMFLAPHPGIEDSIEAFIETLKALWLHLFFAIDFYSTNFDGAIWKKFDR